MYWLVILVLNVFREVLGMKEELKGQVALLILRSQVT